jgi:hypothetical protein
VRKSTFHVYGWYGLCQVFIGLCLLTVTGAVSADTNDVKISATRLVYQEVEDGAETFQNHYLFTDRYLRISDPDDASGYILFDAVGGKIFSISHIDRTVLVIPEYPRKELPKAYHEDIRFEKLPDAPPIEGRPVFTYRAGAASPNDPEIQVCTEIQLVPGLLPEAAGMLRHYMQVMSSQQQMNLEKTPIDMRTPCMLQDQVFNEGAYYDRGLPIREWHSNGQQRLLLDFSRVKVDASLFELPPDYRRYSIE